MFLQSKKLKRFSLFAVLLLVFYSLWAGAALNICYGSDGHIKIERSSLDENCCKSTKDVETTPLENAECSACFDVPIGQDQYTAATNNVSLCNLVILFAAFELQGYSATPSFQGQVYPEPIPFNNPLLASLQTVILLI